MKLVRERQISYDFTHMKTLRDKTDEHKGRETKIIYTGRGTKHETHKYGEQTGGYWRCLAGFLISAQVMISQFVG